jgi:hypothetical protein
MAITWAQVTTSFPGDAGLAALAVGTQDDILERVNNEEIHDATWRTAAKADRARRYLAAHLGSIASGVNPGARGAVQSESVGQVSRSFALSVAQGSNPLDSTGYGKEYMRLVRLQFGGPWVP